MFATLVIVGLIIVWTIVLLPDALSRISRTRRGDTIRSFNSQLSSLGRSTPVGRSDNVIDLRARRSAPLTPGYRIAPAGGTSHRTAPGGRPSGARTNRPRAVSPEVRKRRQDVLVALGAGALLTLLATLAFGGIFLYLHLLADVLLATYLVLLQRAVTMQAPARAPRTQGGLAGDGVGAMAPLSAPMGRSHGISARRIAN